MLRRPLSIVSIVTFLWMCTVIGGYANAAEPDFRPELVAVELTSDEVRPGDPFSVTFKFRNAGTAAAARDYHVFTHFEAPKKSCENIVIHADHVPSEPTTLWQPGKTVVDGPHTLTVSPDAAEGEYFIHVGLYDFGGTGQRLLEVYPATTIHVSTSAQPAAALGPPPLPEAELAKRRQALAARIEERNRVSLDTQAWRFDVDRTSGAWALLDKASNAFWTSSTSQPRFGRITLRNGDRRATWRIDRFDDVVSTSRSLRLVAHPLVDGQVSAATVVFTVVPSPDFEGLQLGYAAVSTGPWQVASVQLFEDAFQVTAEESGSVYIPHRLGIELPASKGLPGNRTWIPYNDLSMAMCGVVKQGSALLISWDQVDARLTTHITWPDLPLVPGRRAVSVSLELDGPANTCIVQPLGTGSYVDIAKAYRPIAQAKGWRRTWTEKRHNTPPWNRSLAPPISSRLCFRASCLVRDSVATEKSTFTWDSLLTKLRNAPNIGARTWRLTGRLSFWPAGSMEVTTCAIPTCSPQHPNAAATRDSLRQPLASRPADTCSACTITTRICTRMQPRGANNG